MRAVSIGVAKAVNWGGPTWSRTPAIHRCCLSLNRSHSTCLASSPLSSTLPAGATMKRSSSTVHLGLLTHQASKRLSFLQCTQGQEAERKGCQCSHFSSSGKGGPQEMLLSKDFAHGQELRVPNLGPATLREAQVERHAVMTFDLPGDPTCSWRRPSTQQRLKRERRSLGSLWVDFQELLGDTHQPWPRGPRAPPLRSRVSVFGPTPSGLGLQCKTLQGSPTAQSLAEARVRCSGALVHEGAHGWCQIDGK